MTTQNIQKKDMHLNIFAKNQGRAAVLPFPTGSFAPAYLFAARQGRRNTARIWRGARNLVRMLVVGVDLLAAEGRWGRQRRKSGRRGSWGWSAVGKEEEEEGGL
jgi:hypothetical protein